ncbi:uncharacterized protein LOC125829893 [Solanum verrucosum]|uniref:uncharacterized protein LOC125829893 n=1 Tax=Solanum verrucosum TaxID=315347 RepID=UPI0020D1036B|nr:uncharacterized protein LOC125829893 [Solanum verrucosum]
MCFLSIQEEEEKKLRLLKRKKAESMRLSEMEKRQKQRVEEMRETQKKELQNMASVLHGLGITVGNGTSHEIRVAYKIALLKFHRDRSSGTNIRQQVEAEEKLKLISRMKEKYLPTL